MSLSSQEWGTTFANPAQALTSSVNDQRYWRFDITTQGLLVAALGLMCWVYSDGLTNLFGRWEAEEEYNHGYFLPLVTLTFLWQLGPTIARRPYRPTWFALVVAAVALFMLIVGELSAIYLLIQYSFVLVLFALSLSLLGWAGTRLTFAPIAILLFAIPIPYFLEATVTSKLQLISSKLGVDLIRFCKIPVFREGNLIDLGVFKLEVIEACSGLTYLYPLLGFSAICAYLYRADAWKRVMLIVSTVPIAILLNSFRIGMIGLLVKNFGNEQAQGFLHDFEGFAVFMVCVGILFGEMWVMTCVGRNREPFHRVFGLTFEALAAVDKRQFQPRPLSKPLLATLAMIAAAAIVVASLQTRAEIKPPRAFFSAFPRTLGPWRGTPNTLEPEVLKTLDLTDYLLADYVSGQGAPVNFYVAYYESQRKGSSPHSPTVCLPGGGWQIVSMSRQIYQGNGASEPFEFNRVVIRKGKLRQLVYYWFDERGRVMADEYRVKWYLFRDALLNHRSDGALVRVITGLREGEAAADADRRINDFLAGALPLLPAYVPR